MCRTTKCERHWVCATRCRSFPVW